jgi:hypothetical protein
MMAMKQWIHAEIMEERGRQAEKWGKRHHWGVGDCSSLDVADIVKAAVLGEECGEVTRAVLEHDWRQTRLELIQVAAVAVAWLEALGDIDDEV